MVTLYITSLAFSVLCIGVFAVAFWRFSALQERERKEWSAERAQLLDRIQAGSFAEYKAQERAFAPVKRREKDPIVKKLEGEPWL